MTRFIAKSADGGEVTLNTPLTFGKYKGKSLEQVHQENGSQARTYMAWLTHALTAETFLVDLDIHTIETIRKLCKSMKIYINGSIVQYQLANFYLSKLGETSEPFIPEVTLPKGKEQLITEKQDRTVSQSIKQFHSLLKELDNGN